MRKQTQSSTRANFSAFHTELPTIPSIFESVSVGKKYVNYGADNKFPDDVWNIYLGSAILQACVNGTSDYVTGGGGFYGDVLGKDIMVNEDETIDEVVKKIVFDYVLFGGFALQCIKDKLNGHLRLYWVDTRRIRISEDGKYAFYSDKWNKYGCKTIKYEIYDKNKDQDNFIFYFKGHISRDVYPIPRFIGALESAATDADISRYHRNGIRNNFNSSVMISFNNGAPSDEMKEQIEKMIEKKFTGAENSNRIMVSFNDDKEHETTITRLDSGNEDDKYQSLSKSVMSKIFISFRATPALFGLNPENNGFSKQEFSESFELYNETVILPIQSDIEKCLKKIGFEYKFIPFNLNKSTKTNDNV